jgi:hypothetical protein
MGNVCLPKSKSIQLDTDNNQKIENEKEIRTALTFLMEKAHKQKTDESMKTINEQLKDTFENEFDFENDNTITKDSLYDHDKFIKAVQHYDKLFKLIKIDSFGLCNTTNYPELSKEIVINYYGYILLRDRCFTDRYS